MSGSRRRVLDPNHAERGRDRNGNTACLAGKKTVVGAGGPGGDARLSRGWAWLLLTVATPLDRAYGATEDTEVAVEASVVQVASASAGAALRLGRGRPREGRYQDQKDESDAKCSHENLLGRIVPPPTESVKEIVGTGNLMDRRDRPPRGRPGLAPGGLQSGRSSCFRSPRYIPPPPGFRRPVGRRLRRLLRLLREIPEDEPVDGRPAPLPRLAAPPGHPLRPSARRARQSRTKLSSSSRSRSRAPSSRSIGGISSSFTLNGRSPGNHRLPLRHGLRGPGPADRPFDRERLADEGTPIPPELHANTGHRGGLPLRARALVTSATASPGPTRTDPRRARLPSFRSSVTRGSPLSLEIQR